MTVFLKTGIPESGIPESRFCGLVFISFLKKSITLGRVTQLLEKSKIVQNKPRFTK